MTLQQDEKQPGIQNLTCNTAASQSIPEELATKKLPVYSDPQFRSYAQEKYTTALLLPAEIYYLPYYKRNLLQQLREKFEICTFNFWHCISLFLSSYSCK